VAPAGAPAYQVEAELDPDQKRLTGHERVHWTNTADRPQSTIFVRTYGVEPLYGPVKITAMKVDAAPVEFTLDRTLVRVPLTRPLAPGAAVDLEFSFAAELPGRLDPVSYSLILNSNVKQSFSAEYGVHWLHGVVALADAFPRVLQAPADGSSPPLWLNDDRRLSALYDVSLTAPAGWTIVSSGVEERQETLADGRVRWHLTAGQTTQFSMVAGKDLQKTTRETAAGTVNVYAPAAVDAIGQDVADRAAAALELYADRFGPLFEQELDLVAIPAAGFAGAYEEGGLIFLGRAYFSDQVVEKEPRWAAEPALAPLAKVDLKAYRTWVVYHELAHGYWAGVVAGSPAAPWAVEGMAEWTMLYALEQLDGPAAANAALVRDERRFQVAMARGEGDGPLRQSYERLNNSRQYSQLFYGKGALFLDGLRRRGGDEAFIGGLRQVLTKYRGRVIPDDEPMQSILDAAGNTPELQAYVHRWLDETHASEDLGPLPESALQLLKTP
jgi:hypothetical protein